MVGPCLGLGFLALALAGASASSEAGPRVDASATPNFVAAIPTLRCGLDTLLKLTGATPIGQCSVLDLRGEVLASQPIVANPYGNGTIVLNTNDTLRLLTAAMSSSSTSLSALLLTGSPSLGDNPMLISEVLGPALGHSSLAHLALDGCNLTQGSIEQLASLIGTAGADASLRYVSLAHNTLGAGGAAALAQALARATAAPLRALHLSKAAVGGVGAAALAASLASGGGASLEMLTIDQNDLGDAGAEAIARALVDSTGGRLASLDLSGNGIGPDGVAALARALADGNGARGAYLNTVSAPPLARPRAHPSVSLVAVCADGSDEPRCAAPARRSQRQLGGCQWHHRPRRRRRT